jgi:hypothetical protein
MSKRKTISKLILSIAAVAMLCMLTGVITAQPARQSRISIASWERIPVETQGRER